MVGEDAGDVLRQKRNLGSARRVRVAGDKPIGWPKIFFYFGRARIIPIQLRQ